MELVCIVCPMGCSMQATLLNGQLTVTGNGCKRGEQFAYHEATNPTRSLTTTVETVFPQMPELPVRTDGELPQALLFDAMRTLKCLVVRTPLHCGAIVLENILNTGCNIIATASILGE